VKYSRTLWIAILTPALLTGCLGTKKQAPIAGTSAEPDKVLYDRAAQDIKHGKYTVGRLGFQTLINTYPDSEYLAKAKLGIGDSYYKEGGVAGLKQAIVEYKDFITFFPFLDEAAYAQMQVAMGHYRQMEKPDRDRSEMVQAEAEFQTFLEKYPNSPLVPGAQQHLREVQEVLAEGNFRVASFYYIRNAYKAAGARLIELTNRYPLYSQADKANWMLAQIYEKTEHNDLASQYYARIVKDYPLSSLAGDAKARLTKFGSPVPQPDPVAMARMQKEQEAAHNRPNMVRRSMTVLKSGPDVTMASHSGAPTMTPASETGDETLGFGPPPTLGMTGAGATGNSTAVETVTPGSPSSLAAQPPANTSTDPAPASSSDSTATTTDNSSGSNSGSDQPADNSSGSDASVQQPANSTTPAPPADKSQESSSKKKKGIHKVLPF
jgi:outer membrane protein assembly factor BamD